MKKLVRHGTVLFPTQTEIHLFGRFSTVNARLSGGDHIYQKQYWSACLCILLLSMAYNGSLYSAMVLVLTVLRLKVLYSVEICGFRHYGYSSKRGLLWGIGKVVTAACRRFTAK